MLVAVLIGIVATSESTAQPSPPPNYLDPVVFSLGPIPEFPDGLDVQDVNGDLFPDLVVAITGIPGYLAVRLNGGNDGTGRWRGLVNLPGYPDGLIEMPPARPSPTEVQIAKINNDAFPDLVTTANKDALPLPGFIIVRLHNGNNAAPPCRHSALLSGA